MNKIDKYVKIEAVYRSERREYYAVFKVNLHKAYDGHTWANLPLVDCGRNVDWVKDGDIVKKQEFGQVG